MCIISSIWQLSKHGLKMIRTYPRSMQLELRFRSKLFDFRIGIARSNLAGDYLNYYLVVGLSLFSVQSLSRSLPPHESQHPRPPCPSPAPGVHPNPCPSSQWCYPAISSSVTPFPSALNPSQHYCFTFIQSTKITPNCFAPLCTASYKHLYLSFNSQGSWADWWIGRGSREIAMLYTCGYKISIKIS